MLRRLLIAATIATLVLVCAGCGSASDEAASNTPAPRTVDGILSMHGHDVTIVGPDDERHDFTTGAKTKTPTAELRALEAADEPVRAEYAGDTLIDAASISDIVADLPSVTGRIRSVSDEAVDLDTADGPVHLVIDPKDIGAMDPAHLREHQAEHEDTVIHFEERGGARHAKGFSDAE